MNRIFATLWLLACSSGCDDYVRDTAPSPIYAHPRPQEPVLSAPPPAVVAAPATSAPAEIAPGDPTQPSDNLNANRSVNVNEDANANPNGPTPVSPDSVAITNANADPASGLETYLPPEARPATAKPAAPRPTTIADFANFVGVRYGDRQDDVRFLLGDPRRIEVDSNGVTWHFAPGIDVGFEVRPGDAAHTPMVRSVIFTSPQREGLDRNQLALLDTSRAGALALQPSTFEGREMVFLSKEADVESIVKLGFDRVTDRLSTISVWYRRLPR